MLDNSGSTRDSWVFFNTSRESISGLKAYDNDNKFFNDLGFRTKIIKSSDGLKQGYGSRPRNGPNTIPTTKSAHEFQTKSGPYLDNGPLANFIDGLYRNKTMNGKNSKRKWPFCEHCQKPRHMLGNSRKTHGLETMTK